MIGVELLHFGIEGIERRRGSRPHCHRVLLTLVPFGANGRTRERFPTPFDFGSNVTRGSRVRLERFSVGAEHDLLVGTSGFGA
ncbi:hypothetical protein [Streptomyces sp. NRRL S-378]|uniref:hypothetical protein n=1 Tax=Streptomyces sp. NRRL S-378 TaxID=1463904 RepID=UPI0018FE9705|nr:hypothetical protein [Streptomyces sp. NRRL S-378]